MTLTVLVPLHGILVARAWGATHLVNGTTRSGFERGVSMRARLVASGARDALAAHRASGGRRKLGAMTRAVRAHVSDLSLELHVVEETNR